MSFPSDLEIARGASLQPIGDVAASIGIGPHLLQQYGTDVAKVSLDAIEDHVTSLARPGQAPIPQSAIDKIEKLAN